MDDDGCVDRSNEQQGRNVVRVRILSINMMMAAMMQPEKTEWIHEIKCNKKQTKYMFISLARNYEPEKMAAMTAFFK